MAVRLDNGETSDFFVSLFDGERGAGYKGQYSDVAGNWSTQGPDDSTGAYAVFVPASKARRVPLAPWTSMALTSVLLAVAVRRLRTTASTRAP